MAFGLSEPLCSTRVGPDWIDGGTLCRTRFQSGVLGKTGFDSGHVYSLAPEARRKRDLDLKIIGEDYSRGKEVSLRNEEYLKKLIEFGSEGDLKVEPITSPDLQFFTIHGGGEGFLPTEFAAKRADDVGRKGITTLRHETTFRFDENDLMVVFNREGKLVSAARLERPIEIPDDDRRIGNRVEKRYTWSRTLADEVYNSWDNKKVHIYRNTYWHRQNPDQGVIYLGLAVEDEYYLGIGKPKVTIDIHKREATNGCIFIVDPKPLRPVAGEDDKSFTKRLNDWEPELIVKVLAAKGLIPKQVTARWIHLGIMRVVEIQ